MKNNSPIEAGQSENEKKLEMVDAINQVFALFRLNYHNQYLKAYANTEELNQVKRLWLEMLGAFPRDVILSSAKKVIENSEFLPTIRTMIKYCEKSSDEFNFPDPHSAYVEACTASSPKKDVLWSHPAVYHAGAKCNWHFLHSTTESVAFPVFKQQYELICIDIREGKHLEIPAPTSVIEKKSTTLDNQTNRQKLKELRDRLSI